MVYQEIRLMINQIGSKKRMSIGVNMLVIQAVVVRLSVYATC